LKIEGLL